METSSPTGALAERAALRQRLLHERSVFAAAAGATAANIALASTLAAVLAELGPDCLGVYWPMRSEFNARDAIAADARLANLRLALPFARRLPAAMEYRAWDGRAPAQVDECNVPSIDGRAIVPDVVLVPCVGFSAEGWRLGYGGGYFDRWLGAHRHVTAVGIAWSIAEIDGGRLAPQPHDVPMTLIVTERGVVGG